MNLNIEEGYEKAKKKIIRKKNEKVEKKKKTRSVGWKSGKMVIILVNGLLWFLLITLLLPIQFLMLKFLLP